MMDMLVTPPSINLLGIRKPFNATKAINTPATVYTTDENEKMETQSILFFEDIW